MSDINALLEFTDDDMDLFIGSDYALKTESLYHEIISTVRHLDKEYCRTDEPVSDFPIKEKTSAASYLYSFVEQGLISISVAFKLLILAKNPDMEYNLVLSK